MKLFIGENLKKETLVEILNVLENIHSLVKDQELVSQVIKSVMLMLGKVLRDH